MTAPRAALVPSRSTGAPLRRAALLLGVLPTTAAILVITLGPPSLVAAGLATTMDAVDRLDAGLGWSLDVDRVESLANLAMFVPLGAFLGLAVRPRSWPLVLLAGAALSAGVELAQTRIPGRVPDVHDVVANTAGDLVGLLAAMLLVGLLRLAAVARRRR